MNDELSSCERVRLALEHRETDRVPIAMVCSGINRAARAELEAYLRRTRGIGVEAYLEPLIDVKGIAPDYRGPALPEGTDVWGVRRRPISYGAGAYDEIAHHPLAAADGIAGLERHPWPRADWWDYGSLAEKIRDLDADRPFCLMASNGNIFETAWAMRGFENIFMDLAEDPDFVHALFERVLEYYLGYFKGVLEAARGRIDLVFTADDIAGQKGLLMSLEMWERTLKPYHARLNRLIHGYGAKVIYHSDGGVMEAVPGLVDMGIDVLQALQFDAQGMDAQALKSTYGERLCFEGGVSVQSTLPFGTPEAVIEETRARMRVLGRQGGYILGPSHAIQDGTPPENIVAMFDTAARRDPPNGKIRAQVA